MHVVQSGIFSLGAGSHSYLECDLLESADPLTLVQAIALPHQNLTPNSSIASGQDIPVEHAEESGKGNGSRITSSCHCSFRASSR